MTRALDVLSGLLLLGAAGAFASGVHALGGAHDLHALYWLVVGAVALRASVDLLRTRGSG